MRHFHIKIFIFITCIFLVNSCNKPDQISKGESRVGSLKFKEVNISVFKSAKSSQSNGINFDNSYSQMKINVKCISVYPDGSDLNENDIVVSSSTNTFDLVKDKTCQISLKEITIGGATFSAVNSNMLILNISPSLTAPNSVAFSYMDPNNNSYYIAANADGSKVNIQYALSQHDAQQLPIIKAIAKPIPVSVSGVPVPILSNLSLYSVDRINNSPATLTLYGSAGNFTSCKLILRSSLPSEISTDWKNIDFIYNTSIIDSKTVFDCSNFKFGVINNFGQYTNNSWAFIFENHLSNNLISSYLFMEVNTQVNNSYTFSLDKSFGNNGIFSKNLTKIDWIKSKITLSSKNEPVISALFSSNNEVTFNFGKLDPRNPSASSIKSASELGFPFPDPKPENSLENMTHIALNDNTSIIAYASNNSSIILAKYTPAGELDTSFGIQGKVTYLLGKEFYRSHNLKLLPNNNFILQIGASTEATGADNNGYYVKFFANGAIDSSFGKNGVVNYITLPYINSLINNFIVLKDNSLASSSYTKNPVDQIIITKNNADGSIDTTFANNGIYKENIIASFSSKYVYSSYLAEGTDASIIYSINTANSDYISKINSSGLLDTDYRTNIKNLFKNSDYNFIFLSNIKTLNDGSLFGVGVVGINKVAEAAFIKIKTDGNPDQTFAKNGIYSDPLNIKNKLWYDFDFTTDNKIYAVGTDFNLKQLIVSRYNLSK
ncbi:hypothetical protein [Fluviispira sanaruensis]|uniref:Uncharacterized protein n=1 Tax=Fluviispira sanaruensis TaxID=2493639 RepID=A0A4V0P2C0_FLUSA|nr:hypothetical protein [Fluviispira sanaruensis]BBH52697.1 hypothetical protein JCM31447_11390 [Fluviispira sanaruensis]